MKAISLIGMAGSGKSTIGKALAERLGFAYISTGDIARSLEIDKSWQERGNLAPEEIMRDAFVDKVNKCMADDYEGVIVDGMPRIADQVNFLCDVFNDLGFIEIVVPIDTAKDRLYNRNREDDNHVAIECRIATFWDNIVSISNAIDDAINSNKVKFKFVYSGKADVDTTINSIIEDIKKEEENE